MLQGFMRHAIIKQKILICHPSQSLPAEILCCSNHAFFIIIYES